MSMYLNINIYIYVCVCGINYQKHPCIYPVQK